MVISVTCGCGCGKQPVSGDYLPGHDQILRARLEKDVGGLRNLQQLVERHLKSKKKERP